MSARDEKTHGAHLSRFQRFRRRRDDCASTMGSNDIACTQKITQGERSSREQQERSPRADRRQQSASTLHSTTLARAKTNAQGRRTSPREAQSSKTKNFLDALRARESKSSLMSPYSVGRRTRVSSTLGREKFAFVRDAVLCNR